MAKSIITRKEECGCVITDWYAVSDCGLFDDGDVYVSPCDWHMLGEAAFNFYLDGRKSQDEKYDEAFWLQVAQAENEWYFATEYVEFETRTFARNIRTPDSDSLPF